MQQAVGNIIMDPQAATEFSKNRDMPAEWCWSRKMNWLQLQKSRTLMVLQLRRSLVLVKFRVKNISGIIFREIRFMYNTGISLEICKFVIHRLTLNAHTL